MWAQFRTALEGAADRLDADKATAAACATFAALQHGLASDMEGRRLSDAAAPAVIPHGDLTACDREPIHLCGAIQPHGALLALDAELRLVRGQRQRGRVARPAARPARRPRRSARRFPPTGTT